MCSTMATAAPTPDVTAEACASGEQVVCHCLRVRACDVREAIAKGQADSLRAVMQETQAGSGCSCCHAVIRQLLAETR